MKRLIASLLAAGVLVGGAATTAFLTGTTYALAEESTTGTVSADAPRRPGALLDEVLGGLVTDGVITDEQRQAIEDAMGARIEEIRAAHPGFPGGRHRGPRVPGGFLDDGVITADEIAQLPEGHPFRQGKGPAAQFLDDGQITAEELQQMGELVREQRDLVREFLADDVITADELAQLAEWNVLRDPDGPAARFLEDGQITREELMQLRSPRPGLRPPLRGAGG